MSCQYFFFGCVKFVAAKSYLSLFFPTIKMNDNYQGQISVINSLENYGLSTSWLLATLGAKKTARKLVRKDLACLSIPKTCESIGQPSSRLSLRMTSNLLYGVSLLYRQQVEYLLNDVGSTNARLQEIHKKTLLYSLGSSRGLQNTSKREEEAHQAFFVDDECFIIEQDFPIAFESDILEGKTDDKTKRKLEIMKIERQINQISDLDIQMSLFQLDDDFTAPHLDDTTLTGFYGISNIDFELENPPDPNETLGFEFNNDGDIVEHVKFDDLTILPNFDTPLQPEVLETIDDPHFSTSEIEPQHHASTLNKDLSVTLVNSKKRKIEIDSIVTTDESQLESRIHEYRSNLGIFCMPKRKQKDGTHLQILLRDNSEFNPQFLNLAYRHIFGSELTSLVPIKRLPNKKRHGVYGIEDIDSLIQNFDEIEVARDLSLTQHHHDDNSILDLGDFENNLDELEDDIDGYDFLLEFSALEQRSRTNTRQSTHNPASDNGTEFDAGPMTRTMYRFLKFIIDLSEQFGEAVAPSEIQSIPRSIGNQEQPAIYHRVSLSQLIPDSSTDVSVSRKIAAKSFLTLLDLATRDMVSISYDSGGLASPKDILVFYCY